LRGTYQRRHSKGADRPPPCDFELGRYRYFQNLTPSQWVNILTLLRDPEVRWEWRDNRWTVEHPNGGVPAYIGPPPVTDAPLEDLEVLQKSFQGTRIVLINLAASDDSILRCLEAWLRDQRKTIPFPIRRRGPQKGTKSSQSSLPKNFLRSLEDYQIIALTHLERSPDYRASPFSNKDLGRFLYPSISPEAQANKVITARALRDEALQLVPVLAVSNHRN
jgi:hypothetical protein